VPGTADSLSRQPTREQPPHPALLRPRPEALRTEATRLDAAYRLQLEAVSRARKAEVALLGTLLQSLQPVLPALARPLQLLDVRAPGRPQHLHFRAILLFGDLPGPRTASPAAREGLFLLEDGTFLRVRFTAATTPADGGRLPVFASERIEGVDVRGVLRDHDVEEVMAVLLGALAAETAHRRARSHEIAAYAARLEAVRVLLAS